jgi:hypothetical protein
VFSRNGAVMTETLETVTKKKPEPSAEQVAADELVRRAREQGLSLTGPDGLLKQLTKAVLETALDQELTEHLGHERNTPAGNEAGNVRNGTRPKTVLTEATGQVGIEVPRDRDGTFGGPVSRATRLLTGNRDGGGRLRAVLQHRWVGPTPISRWPHLGSLRRGPARFGAGRLIEPK